MCASIAVMDTGEPAAAVVPDEDLSLGESPLPPR